MDMRQWLHNDVSSPVITGIAFRAARIAAEADVKSSELQWESKPNSRSRVGERAYIVCDLSCVHEGPTVGRRSVHCDVLFCTWPLHKRCWGMWKAAVEQQDRLGKCVRLHIISIRECASPEWGDLWAGNALA